VGITIKQKMLKNKLNNNELTLGSWLTLGSLSITEIMAKASFDWLVVDLEHSSISIDRAAEMIRIIDLCGLTPLVRLTTNDANQIKRVMDAGAGGIIVPMINSSEEAKKAVKATRYSPNGTRGVGLARAQGYGVNFNEYLEWQANNPVVIVQIEHIEAVDKIEEILTEPGVDGFIIGPYDLSCSMGIPGKFENDRFTEVIDFILDFGKRLKSPAGLHIVEPDVKKLEKTIADGFTFIAYSVDSRMLDVAARKGVSKFNKLKK